MRNTDHAAPIQTSLSSSDSVLLSHPAGLLMCESSHDKNDTSILRSADFCQDLTTDYHGKNPK
jgi:hypothetical protein